MGPLSRNESFEDLGWCAHLAATGCMKFLRVPVYSPCQCLRACPSGSELKCNAVEISQSDTPQLDLLKSNILLHIYVQSNAQLYLHLDHDHASGFYLTAIADWDFVAGNKPHLTTRPDRA